MTKLDLAEFSPWIGKTQIAEDVITPRLVDSFRATFAPYLFDQAEVPLALHWCLSPPSAPMAEIAGDGHPAKGGWLPPIPLPRRMWAGGSVEFIAPLALGDTVQRRSTIADISVKQGGSGTLCFLHIDHDYITPRGIAIRERQDIVYRQPAPPAPVAAVPSSAMGDDPAPVDRWSVAPSQALLFRYSAITFNAHRIHYDLPYTMDQEGYPGLVVQGPLQATLLMNYCASQRGQIPSRFSYRGVSPLIAGPEFTVSHSHASADAMACATRNSAGVACMKAEASW